MSRLKIEAPDKKRSTYPYRAWCPRLRIWIYLTDRFGESYRLSLVAMQAANDPVKMPKFNTMTDDFKLDRIQKNPYYRTP